MSPVEFDILGIDGGTLTAPAGCGKTHLIADALRRHEGSKPVLVLTHTNAGVAALRGRLESAGVSPKSHKLSTIDGWAMRLVSTFPIRSGHPSELLKLENPGSDYPNIRRFAADLLGAGHIDDILRSSFSRLVVDEYQDCSVRQHAVVAAAANTLPTCVLGDPMQAIFGFGRDALANWDRDVLGRFPLVGVLDTPWRWINAGAEELGHWLLDVRARLRAGLAVDLSSAPGAVKWVRLEGKSSDHQLRLAAAREKPPSSVGKVLIIGDSKNLPSQRAFASQTPGAVTVEAVNLTDLITFARDFAPTGDGALSCLAHFAESVMTNVGADDLVRRVQTISSGKARKAPSPVERAALRFLKAPSYAGAADLLSEINQEAGVRAHRPAVVRACMRALQACGGPQSVSFYDAAIQVREQSRLLGRPLPRRAVGSTLLLKGLEAEAVVILNADGLNGSNLYVAMTRGSKHLTVCSTRAMLGA